MVGSGNMRLFSIGINDKDLELKKLIYDKFHLAEMEEIDIEEKKAGNLLFIQYIVKSSCKGERIAKIRDRMLKFVSDTLSGIILKDVQCRIIQKIIQEEYFYFEKKEQEKILQDALAIMWGGKDPIIDAETIRKTWREKIAIRIIEHLQTNDDIIIEGFVRFRLKDFIRELEDAVDRAVDDLLIEKEYNEFIKLLQYFVEIQEPKVDEVHVFQDEDKKYTLLDSSFRVINNDILEELAKEISDSEISYDDLLISSLITIAPSKITIHECDKIKNTELLNTIKNVFNGKVVMSEDRITPRN